ncbi:hypothetical protein [Algibacter lectus]|uniref:Uncharacterized protein n=1 Tax=Algibacter lectus TaxID=221126 RepID=A0A090WW82_9FLAO|nr:hypothetical protein [Algibacter lectus]MDO7136857.1 hypothetical protein [Algibacter lectus]MWW24670.1 hypothetical protein [Algibacter lectus]TDY62691.1 hypothetical protein DFQ06_2540 [Algibacter lectus]GAL62830.1 hypothetical protein JCM19300_3398 [Algibacter lectus]GAL79679.1 hypothetical protein JCM19274_3091 [Algibacter lectus]
MGLKENRFTKTFQEEQFPQLKAQIIEAAGFDVPLNIEWTKLFEDRFLHLYNDSYPKIYFLPFIEALTSITADDMGKEALAESLKEIHITNTQDHHNPSNAFSFSNGILTLDHSPILNADDVDSRTKVLVDLLENNL